MTDVSIALPDVTLLLDRGGVIRQAHLANEVAREPVDDWVGRNWDDTVLDAGGESVRRMVQDACSHGVSPFRQVTQRFPSGVELTLEYNTVRLGADAGLIAVGKNLRAVADLKSRVVAAQKAREQDYWQLRELETRFRLLFDAAQDPVIVLGADDLLVIEANPAALRDCGIAPGWSLPALVAPADLAAVQAMLRRARQHGRAPAIRVHMGPGRAAWMVRALLSTSNDGAILLLQLTATTAASRLRSEQLAAGAFDAIAERMPDGMVVADAGGTVQRANRAFLDLVQAPAHGAVVGENLSKWLSEPGLDSGVLLSAVSRYGCIRTFATTIHGELGLDAPVEISATTDSDNHPELYGLLVRDVTPRLRMAAPRGPLENVLATLGERAGHVPLLKLVKEASDLVERHYIEGALRQAYGNRTAAADMLGISRQSLYTKLGRFGIGGTAAGQDDSEP